MSDRLRQKIRDTYIEIETAELRFEQGSKRLPIARETTQISAALALENSFDNLPIPNVPIT